MIVTRGKTPSNEHFEPSMGEDHAHTKKYLDYLHKYCPTAKDFAVSLRYVFSEACKEVSTVFSDREILGGTPCIQGTRIPVYMILDAVEYYGNLDGVLESYPQLSLDTVKDAIRFSKIVMECPVDNQVEIAS